VAPPLKTLTQYRKEATRVGACLEHPSRGRISRHVYQLKYGPLPPNVHVLHRCDNPSCINFRHLFTGSHTDNMRDAARKGRHVSSDPEQRRRFGKEAEKLWADLELAKKRRKAINKALKTKWAIDPQFRKNVSKGVSENLKKLWKDPAYRAKMVTAQKASAARRRGESAQRFRALWQNPVWRKNRIAWLKSVDNPNRRRRLVNP